MGRAEETVPPSPIRTLVDLLQRRAAERPQAVGFTFLADGERDEIHLTYARLDRQARAIAMHLRRLAAPGARVLLQFHSDLNFIAGFMGCLYAGVIAVPAHVIRRNRPIDGLLAQVADCRPAAVLTTGALLGDMDGRIADTPALQAMTWLATDALALDLADAWRPPDAGPSTVAFLQYTSGSTGAPKGVMVSHGNLMHNQGVIRDRFGHSDRTVVVGWLPLLHDMGLIGNILQPLYLGVPCVFMTPVAFLQKPLRWLQAIARHRATTSGGPNFAYDLCARRVTAEQAAVLDLSCWQVAFNGAEPVRAETLERFSAAFAGGGFRRGAFYPCYGMAEATLLVSGGVPGADPVVRTLDASALEQNRAVEAQAAGPGTRTLVGCGHPPAGSVDGPEVAIVDPGTGLRLPPGQVGEIWIGGSSVAQGYWNRPQASREVFCARVAGAGDGPFLRSGDLGFLDRDELFVTGRLKDVILIRGQNYYPQDIEKVAQSCHPALEEDRSAAFAVDLDGEERLVIAQEVRSSWRHAAEPAVVAAAVREAVARHFDLTVFKVILLNPGGLPRTLNGKIRRQACGRHFLAETLSLFRAGAAPMAPAMAQE